MMRKRDRSASSSYAAATLRNSWDADAPAPELPRNKRVRQRASQGSMSTHVIDSICGAHFEEIVEGRDPSLGPFVLLQQQGDDIPGSAGYGRAYEVSTRDWLRVTDRLSAGRNGVSSAAAVCGKDAFVLKTPVVRGHCRLLPGARRFDCGDPLGFEFTNALSLLPLRAQGVYNFNVPFAYFWARAHVARTNHVQFDDTSPPRPFLLLERVRPGVTYRSVVRRAPEDEIAGAIVQLMLALEVAQAYNRFTHYDLHLDNILLGTGPDRISYTVEGREYVLPGRHLLVVCDFARSYANNRDGSAFGLTPYDSDASLNRYMRQDNSDQWRQFAKIPSRTYDLVRFLEDLFAERTVFSPRLRRLQDAFRRDYPGIGFRNAGLNGHVGDVIQRPLDVVRLLTEGPP